MNGILLNFLIILTINEITIVFYRNHNIGLVIGHGEQLKVVVSGLNMVSIPRSGVSPLRPASFFFLIHYLFICFNSSNFFDEAIFFVYTRFKLSFHMQ